MTIETFWSITEYVLFNKATKGIIMNRDVLNKLVHAFRKYGIIFIGIIALIVIACTMFIIGQNKGNSAYNQLLDSFREQIAHNQALSDNFNILRDQYSNLAIQYKKI